jgi:V/A-type H+-transporting ATPase subunit E
MIIERIAADSASECAEIAAEADRRCAEIRAEFSALEQEEYWKIINAGAKNAQKRMERLAGIAALEAKKQLLSTKQELISGVFDRACAVISSLPEETYVALLMRLVVEASRSGTETLQFSWRDRITVSQTVCDAANARLIADGRRGELTVSLSTRNIAGGVIVINDDIETNCSVEALVAQCKDELTGEIASALLG